MLGLSCGMWDSWGHFSSPLGAWASPVGAPGLLLSGHMGFSCPGAWASPVGVRALLLSGRVGFSGWGVPAPEREGLVVMHSIWDLISLTRD